MALRSRVREEVARQVEAKFAVYPPDPEPAPGCDVCGALYRQWQQAKTEGHPAYDPSHAVDLAIEIKRHPHEWKRKAQSRKRVAR